MNPQRGAVCHLTVIAAMGQPQQPQGAALRIAPGNVGGCAQGTGRLQPTAWDGDSLRCWGACSQGLGLLQAPNIALCQQSSLPTANHGEYSENAEHQVVT